jgi:cation diffusion facilitator family transporter
VHLRATTDGWNPFPPGERTDDSAHRAAANRAIGVSAVGLALTGGAELAVSLLTGSVGLLGDALHNLSDVSTSLVVFWGFRWSKRAASASHPYGYERAEDLAGLGVALVIWASAVFAGVVSIHKLGEHGRTTHLGVGMAAALIGIAGNQLVARYKHRIGGRIRSVTLLADARHSWLDAVASLGALLGLAGVAGGLRWADGVAGLIVTGFIVHVGWEVTSDLALHLMDGVEPEILERAERAALTVDGVEHVHVRGRWAGRSLLIEVEGFGSPATSLGAADAIGSQVQAAVAAAVPESRAVLWSAHSLATAVS